MGLADTSLSSHFSCLKSQFFIPSSSPLPPSLFYGAHLTALQYRYKSQDAILGEVSNILYIVLTLYVMKTKVPAYEFRLLGRFLFSSRLATGAKNGQADPALNQTLQYSEI